VDKISSVPKSKVGERIGRLDDEDVVRLNQALMVCLGLAVSPRTGGKENDRKRRDHSGTEMAGMWLSYKTKMP
jgi:hypothetical protein